jgi:cytochrome c biogenesis protein CcdA/thiol-disulfide isomerase/thioredoxin
MMLFVLAYVGGVLTIVSPCILPVLPFVFARADRPFTRSGLPLLAGMAITFALVASLAVAGGSWVVRANNYGRVVALIVLTLAGLALLSERLSAWLTRPFVALGARLSTMGGVPSARSAFVLGIATGLLWAPCAGPILGLVFTGGAINGASASTTLLLLAYAAGAATSLAAALLIGGRVMSAMKRSLGAGEWVRRGIGIAVLAGVVAIIFRVDTRVLARASLASTTRIEQALIDRVRPRAVVSMTPEGELPIEGMMPSLSGATNWINSPPLTSDSLRGKVVLVDFWTYSCINCLRALPYVRAWAEKYRDHGLVVIGVHSPEFAFERDLDNVRRAVTDLHITYPVAVDNRLNVWSTFNNNFWPAHYFIDAHGCIRGHHFGEGQYDESERRIQVLLTEAGNRDIPGGLVDPEKPGAQAAGQFRDLQSPETYVGYARAEHFAGTLKQDVKVTYSTPANLALNEWGLTGDWTVQAERAVSNAAPARITFRFHARDLHLVLGAPGHPVRFRVTIDGHAPENAHGADIDGQGHGTVTTQRLYQLLRQSGDIEDHTFSIEFLDPDVQVYAFTFG